MKNDPKSSPEKVTPESVYRNRRKFLQTSIFAGTAFATAGVYRYYRNTPGEDSRPEAVEVKQGPGGEKTTSFYDITHYNNFYEFTTDKEGVADRAQAWQVPPWTLEVDGLVEKPLKLVLSDLSQFSTEERIYRLRCVEGWSMVIPWQGFSLNEILQQVKPSSRATHVAFTGYFDENQMSNAYRAGIPFPYVEGLRLDEAQHPLTILATGLYGKPMPNQNGAPVRLVVPWKYGFKSIKSVVKITLTDREPPTTWNLAAPNEYGFYSNVNPNVDHPRWSQAQERRIGESGLRPTLMFNGYEKEVAALYADLDLRKYF